MRAKKCQCQRTLSNRLNWTIFNVRFSQMASFQETYIQYLNGQLMTVFIYVCFVTEFIVNQLWIIWNQFKTYRAASSVTCELWGPPWPSPSAWWWPSPWSGSPPPPSPAAARRTSPRRQRSQTSPSGVSSCPWWSSGRESFVLIPQITSCWLQLWLHSVPAQNRKDRHLPWTKVTNDNKKVCTLWMNMKRTLPRASKLVLKL